MKNNFQLFIQIIKETLYILSPKQKRQLVLVFLTIVATSFLELLGVGIIMPFIQMVLTPEEVMKKSYIKAACALFNIDNPNSVLLLIGIAIILLYIFKNIFIIFAKYYQTKYSTSLQKDLSVDMLKSYLKRPYTYFLDTNSSIIIRGCNSSIAGFYSVIDALISLITEMLTFLLIGIYLILTDWITAISTLVLMLVTLVATVLLFKPLIKKAGKVNKEAAYNKSKNLLQTVHGIKDIMVTKRQQIFVNNYESSCEEARKSNLLYTTLNACPDRITEGLCISGIIGIICIRLIFADASMTSFIPKLAVFAMAAFKLLPSVGKITTRINSIVYNRPLQEEVYANTIQTQQYEENYNTYVASLDLANSVSTYKEMESNPIQYSEELGNKPFTITFSNVYWTYQNQLEPVLKDLNMTIHKGQAIGLIGPSGAGKTTAADILLGLLKPQKGNVSIDDKDIYAMPTIWSKMIGYVPQSVYLIDDTIKANVAFGLSDASDDSIWDALERAQLKDFIENLPNGINTIVGERGVKLSGGQRQRIAIARALFSNPQILVLDEATAALDNETEEAVMKSIEALHGDITMIIIAHRLTTIRKCDKIYEIKDGIATEKSKGEVLGNA